MIINADSRFIGLDDKTVHMAFSSPPYWNLRLYQNDPRQIGNEDLHDCLGWATGKDCGECYVCHIRQVAREVWRVLRDDGIFILNVGDTYGGSTNGGGKTPNGRNSSSYVNQKSSGSKGKGNGKLKTKDLVLIPHRVVLALQADGWYVRNTPVWVKTNPLPHSVEDRLIVGHEDLFLLSKQEDYYFDFYVLQEKRDEESISRDKRGRSANHKYANGAPGQSRQTMQKAKSNDPDRPVNTMRRRRDVITTSVSSYKGKHSATFPPELVIPFVQAGTSSYGCCPKCNTPYVRVLDRVAHAYSPDEALRRVKAMEGIRGGGVWRSTLGVMDEVEVTMKGWRANCECYGRLERIEVEELTEIDLNADVGDLGEYEEVLRDDQDRKYAKRKNTKITYIPEGEQPKPNDLCLAIVLDPFAGSGTVGLVCRMLGNRLFVGCDLNNDYLREEALPRAEQKQTQASLEALPLFQQV